jgi:hypothetical protein
MKYTHILLSLCFLFSSPSLIVQAKTVSEWVNEAKMRMVSETLPNGLTVVCYPLPERNSE